MSQYDFGVIDPTTKNGGALASDLNNWRDALHSTHIGSERPSYAVEGMIWIKDVSASLWALMLFTGTVDIQIGTIDPNAGTFTLNSLGASFSAIPTLPATDPTNANHAVRKSYVDAAVNARLPLTGGTLSDFLMLANKDPTQNNHAVRKSYVDARTPSAKTGVLHGSWTGDFDLPIGSGSATIFFDIMLPDNTYVVLGTGWMRGIQSAGGAVVAGFDVQLLNQNLAVIASGWFCNVGSDFAANSWWQSGGRVGGFTLDPGNSGWRLRFRGWKDTATGPFRLLAWEASCIYVLGS